MILGKRILAIDVGQKRIGLAQSDPTQTIASPVGTFSEKELFDKLTSITGTFETVVIGWPVSLRGHEGNSTEMVRQFSQRLSKRFPDIKIEFLDERFTSSMATQTIRNSGVNKTRRQEKGLVDTVAAAILLQSYLDKPKY